MQQQLVGMEVPLLNRKYEGRGGKDESIPIPSSATSSSELIIDGYENDASKFIL